MDKKLDKQNILLVDAGNSAVKWCIDSSAELSSMAQKYYPENITESFFTGCWNNIEAPDKIVVTCVASEQLWQVIVKVCDTLWKIKPERVVSIAKGFGLISSYELHPSELGSDRWCAMIGAYHEANSDVVVIDCGSAITIDVVEHSGQHMGGYILPGLEMMKQSLGFKTAQIKVTAGQNNNKTLSPGRNTEECVNAGIYLAAVTSIEAVLNKQFEQLNDLQCFLTGGDAPLIAELLSMKCVMMPDLVLRGLAFIASDN